MASDFKQQVLDLTTMNQMQDLIERGHCNEVKLIFTRTGWIVEADNKRSGAPHKYRDSPPGARDVADAVQELHLEITGQE